MNKLVLTLTVLAFCSLSFAQGASMKKRNLQAEGAWAAQNPATQAEPATNLCSFNFTSGSSNTYLSYCVTQNGNILYITTPVGRGQSSTDEGYGWCDTSSATSYFDYGPRFGESGNWNPAVVVSQTATVVKIARTTSDGLWTLTQTIAQLASTSSAKVAMTLKNNSSEAKEAHIVRYVYATPDDVIFANYDGTQNSAFTWNSIGSGTHPFGLVLQNVGTSPFFGYNGFAQNTASPPNPCDYAANWTGGLATNINGSLVMVYVGTVPAHASKTLTMSYKGL
jgi:hypothetical protein